MENKYQTSIAIVTNIHVNARVVMIMILYEICFYMCLFEYINDVIIWHLTTDWYV